MKLISVVTPCYNEQANIRQLHTQIQAVFAKLPGYAYEHICIDNASSDETVAILRERLLPPLPWLQFLPGL